MVEFLLANKAEINAKDNDGRTPLSIAAVMAKKKWWICCWPTGRGRCQGQERRNAFALCAALGGKDVAETVGWPTGPTLRLKAVAGRQKISGEKQVRSGLLFAFGTEYVTKVRLTLHNLLISMPLIVATMLAAVTPQRLFVKVPPHAKRHAFSRLAH